MLSVSFAALASAQTEIAAPPGWKTQIRANGARVFTPPDLKTGEVFSVTVYDSAPLGGKTLSEYLRTFAGQVGKKPGQLAAPLDMEKAGKDFVRGNGVYLGPKGTALGARFNSFSRDGANVYIQRLLTSHPTLLDRYADSEKEIWKSLLRRATEASTNGDISPSSADGAAGLKKVGGALQPGVYAGYLFGRNDELQRSALRLYLYANGEFRLCDENDKDLLLRGSDQAQGRYAYNRATGQLQISDAVNLVNDPASGRSCLFGQDASGKATIIALGEAIGVTLRYAGPPTKRLSSEGEAARRGWKAAPGRGVKNAQIAAIALDSRVSGTNEINEKVYLLLRDGTIRADLPVPPDQLDAALSRQRESDKWGRWRKVGGDYQVSWAGGPFEKLPCDPMLPAPRGIRLSGRYSTGRASGMTGTGNSYSLWGVIFSPDGRFSKDRSGGATGPNVLGAGGITPGTGMTYDNNGSSVVLGGSDVVGGVSQKSRNPKADREGTYFINGYTITLRYDNGLVARWPFFFVNPQHTTLWFENATLARSSNP